MRKYLALFVLFSCLHVATRGQIPEKPDLSGLPVATTAQSLRYWFDDQTANIQTLLGTSGTYSIDVSTLDEGLHTLYCQVMDNLGGVSFIKSSLFLKLLDNKQLPASTPPQSLRYWFDSQTDIFTSDVVGGIQSVDVSALDDGLHTIHYQIVDSEGNLCPIVTSSFIKTSSSVNIQTETVPAKTLQYWFDNDQTTKKTVNVALGTQVIDVSGMEAGIHTLNYQLVDITGNPSTPVAKLFLKPFPAPEVQGDNHITKYEYWMNSMNSSLHTITVDNASNPYQLTELLPMPKEAIRSQSFHFEIVDGSPMLYAKNDFNIRFHDARGYFVQQTKSFIDYSVSQAITDIEPLEPGVRATTEKPEQNAIKWYCLEAEAGDSLQFKLDRAASIQLFAPSGDEVYHVSGSESVKWGGLHTRENGTYYLALHDVTAISGSTISIDYTHIDKYAVLRQDVSVVGNGGCTTITFEGNGFQDLYAVDLVNESGDIIPHVFIGHESNAKTTVVFDFDQCNIGLYNAVFHFTDEDKVFKNLLRVETEKAIELETVIKYNTSFVRGGKSPLKVTINNKGNNTAYRVPIYIVVKCQPGAIKKLKIEDDGIGITEQFADNFDYEGLTEIERTEINNLFKEIESDPTLYIFEKDDEDGNPMEESHVIQGFADIAPKSSVTFSFSAQANGDVTYYTNVPGTHPVIKTRRSKDADFRDIYCNDVKEALDCAIGAASMVSDLIADNLSKVAPSTPAATTANIVSCGMNLLSFANEAAGRAACSGYQNSGEQGFLPAFWEGTKLASSLSSVVFSVTKCANRFIPGKPFMNFVNYIANNKKKLQTINKLSQGVSAVATIESCLNALEKVLPKKSTAFNSIDPNEIYGYTAESGSKDVKDGQTDVYYTIQFENDPTFATAPAHDIYLTDNLDVDKFDLSTFCPTSVRIGNKTAELDGAKNFVTTLDMRPEIYAIAQVEGTFDEQTGNASWHISTLDPMTMEPTTDAMIGVLPVNNDGLGIGEVSYNISLKPDLAHGSEVKNQAGIVFDNNEEILTPVWTNVIDKVAPESRITAVEQQDESTASISVNITDKLSGPWCYDVYVQYGTGSAWMKAAENVPAGSKANVKIYEGINHGFYVVAKDMAGNVEQKEAAREYTLITEGAMPGDVNGDGKVTITDAVAIISYIRGENPQGFNVSAADVNGDEQITLADAVAVIDSILGRRGS